MVYVCWNNSENIFLFFIENIHGDPSLESSQRDWAALLQPLKAGIYNLSKLSPQAVDDLMTLFAGGLRPRAIVHQVVHSIDGR